MKPSALVDTRVIYCGDNLDQLDFSRVISALSRTPTHPMDEKPAKPKGRKGANKR